MSFFLLWGSIQDTIVHFSHSFWVILNLLLKPFTVEMKFCWLVRNPFSTSLDRWQPNYFLWLKPISSSGVEVSVSRYISSSGPALIYWVCLEQCVKNKDQITFELCDQLAMSVLGVGVERSDVCQVSAIWHQNVSHLSILSPCSGREPIFECWIWNRVFPPS